MSIASRKHQRSDMVVPSAVTSTSLDYQPGDSHAILSWTAPQFKGRPTVSGYILARDDGGGVENGPWSDIYPATSTSLDFLFLKSGTYQLSVTPFNKRGRGETTTVSVVISANTEPIAPSQAINGGYNTLSFIDDFDSIDTIDFVGDAVKGQGYKWTTRLPFTNDPAPSTPENTSVSNSVLKLGQNGNNLNQGIFTSNRATRSHLVGPFQYGYYEAKIKFDAAATDGQGWPSFWSIGASHVFLDNSTRWPELDFFEFAKDTNKASGGVFAASVHDHDRTSGAEVDHWNAGYNTIDVKPTTWNTWHTYGCLWQPGKIVWYFDENPISTQTYSETGQYPPTINGNPPGAYSILDNPVDGPATIILGTGISCPMYIDWVRIWQ